MTRIALAVLLGAGLASAAEVPSVELVAASGKSQTVHAVDLEKLQPRDVTVTDPHGKQTSRYRGVPLFTALTLLGVAADEPLRGDALVSHVRVEASDGYRVAFSLAELDPRTGSTEAFLVYREEDHAIDAEHGPFRLVVPTDKRGARWVRQVARIRVAGP